MKSTFSHQRRSLLGLLLGSCLPVVNATSAPVIRVQTEPSLAHGMALIQAALAAAGFSADLAHAPYATESRNLHEMMAGRTHINMLPATPHRLDLAAAGKLRMIPVPLERGLLGWRTPFILQDQQDRFATIRTLEDLRTLTVGQGSNWLDVEIYRTAGIATRELQAWRHGEFVAQMRTGVIDLFPMGLEESLSYFLPYFRTLHPQLALGNTLLLRYPWYRFIWVSPHPDADELYLALQKGFDIICNNGEFEAIWNQTRQAPPTATWQEGTVIDLENPFYGPDFVPQRYQHLLLNPNI